MVEKSQKRMNASTAGSRAWFASHRQRIEALLRRSPKGGRLCVLGAGNCNDLDLPELADHFGEIHLVDLDETAARGATHGLGLTNVVVHAPLDITGVAAIVSTWGMPRPTDATITHAMHLAESGGGMFMDGGRGGQSGASVGRDHVSGQRGCVGVPTPRAGSPCQQTQPARRVARENGHARNVLAGPECRTVGDSGRPARTLALLAEPIRLREVERMFDVVLSPCVLSQLIVSVRDALGYQHPRYPDVRRSIQLGHARLMTRLLRPGGRAVLLVDAVSSERADRVAQLEAHETRDALATWIERGLHFPGLEPATIARVVREAAPGAAVEVDTDRPWIWRLGERKAFVVYACQWSVSAARAYP